MSSKRASGRVSPAAPDPDLVQPLEESEGEGVDVMAEETIAPAKVNKLKRRSKASNSTTDSDFVQPLEESDGEGIDVMAVESIAPAKVNKLKRRSKASNPTKKKKVDAPCEAEALSEQEENIDNFPVESEESRHTAHVSDAEPTGDGADAPKADAMATRVDEALKKLRAGSKFGAHFSAVQIAEAAKCKVEDAMAVLEDRKKMSAKQRVLRERAVAKGYRKLAEECGYRTNAKTVAASGFDVMRPVLSVNNIKNMAQSMPSTPGEPSYNANEFAARLDLMDEPLTAAAARETQAFIEPVFRQLVQLAVKEAVVKNGVSRVKPSHVKAALAPHAEALALTGIAVPTGLVAYAKTHGCEKRTYLPCGQGDKKKKRKWNTDAKKNATAFEAKLEQIDSRKKPRVVN